MKLALTILLATSWLQAGTISPKKKPRPAPIEPDVAVQMPELPWRKDANGFYWVKSITGQLYGDKSKEVLRPYGKPFNP